ncbi:RHS repeat-associated core domain-containing protein [Pseudoteredinibacter isoporae]|uniref:RHS repeat-associated protein n=1 Tax=Pseudoteredinibacter isoporae TaxID=570281 RepID=A0A7X0JX73_9GAMM|nr:RHS repeat-associated core domain-containing protein [Pseudoteredinibacter isoporae]MBB6523343.1 RHS repeat-associated protein [Pseudoteredinibacter isoporae]NHO88856.1 hypothetical protein [Pseudoteredinibacter isoporae]NIB24436.1 hypothetical protein [Pseudoteredinibacter isoporae]
MHSLLRSPVALFLFSQIVLFSAQQSLAAQTATPPGLSLPNFTLESNLGGVYRGELPGQARVDHLGAAVYEIPFEIPEHIGALRPNLSIYYNSNAKEGLLGQGWSIRGIDDKIERCPKTMLHDGEVGTIGYDSDDRFCLNGQRLIAVQGVYGANGTEYRTENDRFARVTSIGQSESGPLSFKVETKSGLIKHYGVETSKIEVWRRNLVVTWALGKVEDRSGNMYKYQYDRDSNYSSYQIRKIIFGHNNSFNDSYRVEFKSEGSWRTGRQGGFRKTLSFKRIQNAEIYVGSNKVSTLYFRYKNPSPVDQLTSIKKCGKGGCPETLNIEWAGNGALTADPQFLTVPFEPIPTDGSRSCPKEMQDYPRWHDFDGDGRVDYLFFEPQSSFAFDASSTLNPKLWLSSRDAVETWSSDAANDVEELLFGDIDNDGKTDIVNVDKDVSGNIEVSLSTGTGFSTQNWGLSPTDPAQTVWGNQTYTMVPLDSEHSLRDVNSDGRLDFVSIYRYSTRRNQGGQNLDFAWFDVYVRLNTGSDFSVAAKWAAGVNGYYDKGRSWVDINSDGLIDIVSGSLAFHINNGSTFSSAQYWSNNSNNYPYEQSPNASYMDVNKDGLPDRLEYKELNGQTGWHYRINDGSGFESYDHFYTNAGLIPDVNGDGYLDSSSFHYELLQHIHAQAAHNSDKYKVSGGVSVLSPPYGQSAGGSFSILNGIASGDATKGHNFHRQILDFNNDGKSDHVISLANHCKTGYFRHVPIYTYGETGTMLLQINKTVDANKVSKITNSVGAYSEFSYDSIANGAVHTASSGSVLPMMDVTGGRTVVHALKQPNGVGGEWTKTYHYQGRKLSVDGRGDLGFEKITVSNSQTGIATKTHYSQAFPTIGRPVEVEKQHIASSRRLSRTQYSYASQATVGSGPVFPYVSSSTSQKYDPEDGRLLSTRIVNNTVDTFGNVTQSNTELNDHETGIIFNTQKQRNFTINTSTWRLAQLDQEQVQFGQGGVFDASLTRTTGFNYYPNGLVQYRYQEPNAGAPLELTQSFEYNSKGRPVKVEISGPGITTRSSLTEYHSWGLQPKSMHNAVGHKASYAWSREGFLTSQQDANGLTQTFSFDNYGSSTGTVLPDGNTVQYAMRRDTSGQNNGAKYYTEVVPSGKPAVRTFYDMLGRPVRVRTQSFDGRYVNKDTQYDAHGRQYRVSEPYFDGDPRIWNTTHYDAYHRISSVDAADNVSDTTFDYDGFEAGVKDNANRRQVAKTNANGWLIESVDKAGTKTDFSYNAAGQRTRVRSAVGLSKQFSVLYQYDRLGRMTQQDDPSHGVYSYEYNALGQRTKEVSPKMWAASQSVQFAYDLLGRMTHRYEPEGTTTWEYDNTANGNMGLGKLHRESMPGFSRQYAYAAGQFGRLTSTTTQIQSVSYTEGMSYDSEGNLETITYPVTPGSPSGWKARYQYNDLGFLERVTNDADTEVYYQLVNTDAAGRLTEQWMGDGSTLTQAYAANSLRVTSQQTVKADNNALQHFNYAYDNLGNMTQRQDVTRNLSEVFTYDNLDRLTSAQVAGQTKVDYGFDETDNITLKSDIGIYGYSTTRANAVIDTVLNGVASNYSYDDNGNFFAGDNMPGATWSSYNKPLTLTEGSHRYEFSYGPNRARYRQLYQETGQADRVTHYVGGNFEVIAQGSITEYRHLVRANGRVVMMRREKTGSAPSTDHEYLHRDHLGSITTISKESDGSVLGEVSYDAWGKRRSATDWASAYQAPASIDNFDRGYTGHEHLSGVDIIHMNGRVYSAELGKMMSPDPVTSEPDNGRNYNRYTYAYNNPLKYVDLNGYEVEDAPGATCPRDGPPACPGPGPQGALNAWLWGVGAYTPQEEDDYDGWVTGDNRSDSDAPKKEEKDKKSDKPAVIDAENTRKERFRLNHYCNRGDNRSCDRLRELVLSDIAKAYEWIARYRPDIISRIGGVFSLGTFGVVQVKDLEDQPGRRTLGRTNGLGVIFIDPMYETGGELTGILAHELLHSYGGLIGRGMTDWGDIFVGWGWSEPHNKYDDRGERHGNIYQIGEEIENEYNDWAEAQDRSY